MSSQYHNKVCLLFIFFIAEKQIYTMRNVFHKKTNLIITFIYFFICSAETWGTKLQRKLFAVIYDPFAVLFIILCILLNTVALALDHHNMTYELARVLTSANYVSSIPPIISIICCSNLCFPFIF